MPSFKGPDCLSFLPARKAIRMELKSSIEARELSLHEVFGAPVLSGGRGPSGPVLPRTRPRVGEVLVRDGDVEVEGEDGVSGSSARGPEGARPVSCSPVPMPISGPATFGRARAGSVGGARFEVVEVPSAVVSTEDDSARVSGVKGAESVERVVWSEAR